MPSKEWDEDIYPLQRANVGSDDGLMSDDIKPLSKPMATYYE